MRIVAVKTEIHSRFRQAQVCMRFEKGVAYRLMTFKTEFGPGRFAAVTAIAFTLFKRFMLNLAQ